MTVIIKKDGKLSEIVKFAFLKLSIYKVGDTYETAGSAMYTHYKRSDVGKALDAGAFEHFGIRYKVRNDSPRGGKLGEYVLVNEENRKKIELILKAFE